MKRVNFMFYISWNEMGEIGQNYCDKTAFKYYNGRGRKDKKGKVFKMKTIIESGGYEIVESDMFFWMIPSQMFLFIW